jgi:nucleotide-binding universal stress UspA family protein
MFNKILVATDGSDNSIRGAERALELAKLTNSEVTIVHVAYIPELYTEDLSSELKESIINDGKLILKDTENIFNTNDYPVKTLLIREEKPANAICRISKDYDVIVIGSRGLHKQEEKQLGSVSNTVIHCSSCSVFIVK